MAEITSSHSTLVVYLMSPEMADTYLDQWRPLKASNFACPWHLCRILLRSDIEQLSSYVNLRTPIQVIFGTFDRRNLENLNVTV